MDIILHKQDLFFAGVWLSEIGGRLKDLPQIEIAERDAELIEIPGRSGDLYLDYNRYKNVPFSRTVIFANRGKLPTGHQIDKALKWLAYSIGYQEFRDTQHPQAFSKAVLLNTSELIRELPRLSTVTLNFSRIPYWYSDEGQIWNKIDSVSRKINIDNPYSLNADADYRITALPGKTNIIINGILYENIEFSEQFPTFSVDREYNQIMLVNYDTGGYKVISGNFPSQLIPGENTISISFSNSGITITDIKIKPNWRFL